MRSSSSWLAGIAAAALPCAALANPTCDLVAKAMLKVGEQPGLRQTTFIGTPPRIMAEAVSLKDAMYVREGGRGAWRRVGFDQDRRRTMAENALKSMPLSECSGPKSVTEGGVPYEAYSYRQPDPLKPGAFASGAIWLGTDGLLRRTVIDDSTYQTVEYGDFPAPK